MSSRVYRIGSVYGTEYVGTRRDAERTKPGGEEPDSVDVFGAVDECNRLLAEVESQDAELDRLRLLVSELLDQVPDVRETTAAGRELAAYLEKNPAPRADSADRDGGGRSYGV